METIWWNSHTFNLQNKKRENVETNFILIFPINRRSFRSEFAHSTSVPFYVTSLEEMPSSQMFETNQVTRCQNVTVLWPSGQIQHTELFWVQDVSAQVIIQRLKREKWYTHHGSFQSWQGYWNSETPQRRKAHSTPSMPLMLHPHQHMTLRQDKVCAQKQGTEL